MAKLQHQHSTGGQGFSPKVAQQLGLGRQESAQDGPGRANGQAAQANGPIMTFGQPAPKVQHQPVAASSRYCTLLCVLQCVPQLCEGRLLKTVPASILMLPFPSHM